MSESTLEKEMVTLDFQELMGSGDRVVTGTCKDLIRDGHDNPMRWLHNGHAQPDDRCVAFLVGRGWTATRERLEKLNDNGIPWMAINDYPADGPKPRYWCAGDPPSFYGDRIFDDPDVMKFCPMSSKGSIRPRADAYQTPKYATDAPNVHFFHHASNETELESWLHLPWIPWGTTLFGENTPKQFYKNGAARSSMLIGLRLLWHLGYREVCLLGCDCTPHHHPAPEYWNTIFYLLDQLKPTFDRFCYSVYQTNRDSHLRTFPFLNFNGVLDALKRR